ncbi:hemerythrin HHE cation binding domain-containing protein [Pseudomassariella vexata]|uniref:Hemerythrin HHE cation binding domain-containing protein n=1 Tax=Pseudomassariella vexata TaxID=1141098 RepID=A0A1Y2DQN9_9PEZI|nr:hemerythrin HHE cation binding domain-containing protein [Pseudomassariella vexata]ORY61426.1 hemerythrin HHE cation binding domain-containing protein [Pseudomassariella vexata]
MGPLVYADHPFPLIPTPIFQSKEVIFQKDMFTAAATEMACVHNMLIRGLNAIWLQAPYITEKDEKAFLHFINVWHLLLQTHHTGEEDTFFPLLAEMTGEKEIMKANVEQHHAFEKGVLCLISYVSACLTNQVEYNGARIVQLVDSFASVLVEHLSDEIPTLLDLRCFGDKLAGMPEKLAKEGEKHMKAMGLFKGAVFCLATHDLAYEGGLHTNFPPIPKVLLWALRNLGWYVHSDWWRFAPCDRQGKMRPLYAAITKAPQ